MILFLVTHERVLKNFVGWIENIVGELTLTPLSPSHQDCYYRGGAHCKSFSVGNLL